ncbi:MAG: hypothetical protein AB1585_04835 [Thermodesulfobacteriota bacterium]
MERKEDLILECFVLKGKGVDWLAVIYVEEKNKLKAFSRIKISNRTFQIHFFGGADQKELSNILCVRFQKAADHFDLSPIHLEYPGGISEQAFLQGLREAQREGRNAQERIKN